MHLDRTAEGGWDGGDRSVPDRGHPSALGPDLDLDARPVRADRGRARRSLDSVTPKDRAIPCSKIHAARSRTFSRLAHPEADKPPSPGPHDLFALTGAKADERETLRDMLDTTPDVQAAHPRQTIIADKNYYGRQLEHDLTERDLKLLRPARKGESERAGAHLFKPLRQIIKSIDQTLKGQLDLERHEGKSPAGVTVRVLLRILALPPRYDTTTKPGNPSNDP
ncbi:hypothetical protein FB559_7551 [Actinoallomurus bryophytorum]|uniref:DDE family transposase n=1 Tax=Actinoallomurus bryophytorum TaxID=1490222 RepID=A0A543BZL6_9ACTN|nr:hypothetical protein FB559_7551 [Actinoallomurus bryophytorum]